MSVYPFLWQQAPRPWQIAPARGSQPALLQIGQRTLALRDIAGLDLVREMELNADGHFAMIGSFGAVALGLFFAVLSGLAQSRFVWGGVLFMIIAIFGLIEVAGRRPISLLKLHIRLRDGSRETFVAADPRVIEGLARALAAALQSPDLRAAA